MELFGYIQKQRDTKLLLHKDFMSQNQDENILNIPEVGEVFFLSPFLTLSLKNYMYDSLTMEVFVILCICVYVCDSHICHTSLSFP